MQLITTAEKKAWPSNKLSCLLLGEWCCSSNVKDILKDYTYTTFPYHFDNRKNLYKAYEYCHKIHESLLDDLMNTLNVIFETDNDKRYWRITLGFWLWCFVVIFYDRYLSLKRVLEIYPNIETIVLNEKSHIITKSSIEFFALSTTDQYNLQIYSQIWKYLHGNVQHSIILEHSGPGYGEESKVRLFRKLLSFQIFQYIFRIIMFRADILTFRPYIANSSYVKWFSKSMGAIFPFEIFIDKFEKETSLTEVDNDLRNTLKTNLLKCTSKKEDGFYKLCHALIPSNIPISIFERYSRVSNTAQKLIKKNPVALISANGFLHDVWNIISAEKATGGTKLINLQHGGGYGIQLYSGFEDHEISISDYYVSWGWEGKDDKIIPLPSPLINNLVEKLKKRNRKLNSKKTILIVGNDYPRYFYRLFSHPVGKYITEYRRWFENFLEYLDDSLYNDTLLRLYPIDYDSGRKDRIMNRFPNIRIDDLSVTFNDRLLESKIIISDTNQTTYLQSLAINKPTVIFWNPESSEIRDEVTSYMDRLMDVGIYHTSPNSAAEMISNIYPNIDDWWFSLDTQRARKKFIEKFATVSNNWDKDWLRYISKTINSEG